MFELAALALIRKYSEIVGIRVSFPKCPHSPAISMQVRMSPPLPLPLRPPSPLPTHTTYTHEQAKGLGCGGAGQQLVGGQGDEGEWPGGGPSTYALPAGLCLERRGVPTLRRKSAGGGVGTPSAGAPLWQCVEPPPSAKWCQGCGGGGVLSGACTHTSTSEECRGQTASDRSASQSTTGLPSSRCSPSSPLGSRGRRHNDVTTRGTEAPQPKCALVKSPSQGGPPHVPRG